MFQFSDRFQRIMKPIRSIFDPQVTIYETSTICETWLNIMKQPWLFQFSDRFQRIMKPIRSIFYTQMTVLWNHNIIYETRLHNTKQARLFEFFKNHVILNWNYIETNGIFLDHCFPNNDSFLLNLDQVKPFSSFWNKGSCCFINMEIVSIMGGQLEEIKPFLKP